MDLAAALGAAIRGAGMTQEQIETATGIDQGRLSKLINFKENRRPTLDEIRRIEAACGYDYGYVLGSAGLVTSKGVRAGEGARRHTDRIP